jgi:hypothetical protein
MLNPNFLAQSAKLKVQSLPAAGRVLHSSF